MSDGAGTHPTELLSAYLDDELPVEERARVDRHLADCAACRNELESLWVLSTALREEKTPDVPPGLSARIGRAIDAPKVVPFRRRRWVVPASIAATVGAVGLLVALRWYVPEPAAAPESAPAPAPTRPQAVPTATPAPAPPEPVRVPDEPLSKYEADKLRSLGYVSGGGERRNAAPDAELDAAGAKQKKDERLDAAESADSLQRNRDFKTAVGGIASPPAAGTAAPVNEATGRVEPNATAPAPAPAAVLAALSTCGDRWIDTSVLGVLPAADRLGVLRELASIASAAGGRSESVDPYPDQVALIVPRERYPALVQTLVRRGVTGLGQPSAPEEGFACVRQRIKLVPPAL